MYNKKAKIAVVKFQICFCLIESKDINCLPTLYNNYLKFCHPIKCIVVNHTNLNILCIHNAEKGYKYEVCKYGQKY